MTVEHLAFIARRYALSICTAIETVWMNIISYNKMAESSTHLNVIKNPAIFLRSFSKFLSSKHGHYISKSRLPQIIAYLGT